MQPFVYQRVATAQEALASASSHAPGAAFLAGGTVLLDLMKLGSLQPSTLVDINDLSRDYGAIEERSDGLWLGALVRMAEAAKHPVVAREYPVVAQSLLLAASAQLRNMASLAGNVLQRTRCNYFRDPSYRACNKRNPGSGCAAIGGVQRKHAVLGVSPNCIASYPGDFAQALVALDARVELLGPTGSRTLAVEELHLLPGDTPHRETVLRDGELVTGFFIPREPNARRSLYVKVRDRESYEFALSSAAVVLELDGATVRHVRIALGGLAAKPWRARAAEQLLVGGVLDEASACRAAEAAFRDASTHGEDSFKPELGRRTVVRALLEAAALEV
jgi:xanthine dehydrogenase YagS FAD-binding subunit